MHKYILLFIAATLVSVNTVAAEKNTLENWQQDALTHRIQDSHYSMFDGVKLTEQQRQQLRDLMSLASRDTPRINISEMERLHTLVTAKTFDEAAVREQTEKMAQEQVARQVEMARVRNQMYNLLTPEQQQILVQKHLQRINDLKLQMVDRISTSAQKPAVNE
ncbi:P pilus assembly/Cpx signaling pathway periplasmic inhibitor/zinc- resistance associated protein [Candidatus Sodalis pierantonius str. SOPE]|uniref:P pilus assembly/Cpx signaling pathway periplasmic inhibitor/zinc-resistance associated protein n=1 Tax=Candidatus Sodalis pierantonii str. SOPE TaxID=2342 RepID=W0HMI9_9GAMM|nr:cell-envelope stress modulator CpxP [Candidatus Sodalis pierantonius]AHF73318.1 P pilus assembly/Cpx signaling pathway periplasmic inhibitor/zinc- resistance associated protein [Candidatus Sodalis pierantonius str. SOPE]